MEAEKKKKTKTGMVKLSTTETLATISDDCNNIFSFLQAVVVKSPRFIMAPLFLRAENHTQIWLPCWTDVNLPTPPKPATQYHMGLMGVLTNVVTRLHTSEALRPAVSAQREAENGTKGWDRLPPTSQCVILTASATTRTSIRPCRLPQSTVS